MHRAVEGVMVSFIVESPIENEHVRSEQNNNNNINKKNAGCLQNYIIAQM